MGQLSFTRPYKKTHLIFTNFNLRSYIIRDLTTMPTFKTQLKRGTLVCLNYLILGGL